MILITKLDRRRTQRLAGLAVLVLMAGPGASAADDPLSRARVLYNQKQFEAAVNAAEQARLMPARADAADLVAARAYLERYRQSAASDDLTNARERLRRLDPQRFAPPHPRLVGRRPRARRTLAPRDGTPRRLPAHPRSHGRRAGAAPGEQHR